MPEAKKSATDVKGTPRVAIRAVIFSAFLKEEVELSQYAGLLRSGYSSSPRQTKTEVVLILNAPLIYHCAEITPVGIVEARALLHNVAKWKALLIVAPLAVWVNGS